MKRIALFMLLSIIIFGLCTFSFATEGNMIKDAAEDVRNGVGAVENTVEDAARDISNGSKNVTRDIERGMNNVTNMNTNNNNYSATRTSADFNNANTFGIANNAWVWIIVALVAVAIIILAYSYATQYNSKNYHDNDE